MPLLKDNQFIEDTWVRLDDEADIPFAGGIIVSLARLLADYGKLANRDGRLGLDLPNSERPAQFEVFLTDVSLVSLNFPKFADGRAYSQARQLRQLGYTGELRATGDVLPDQLAFMLEVGFDQFEVTERFPQVLWEETSRGLSLSYQPVSQSGRLHVWQARQTAGPVKQAQID